MEVDLEIGLPEANNVTSCSCALSELILWEHLLASDPG
jgi:hypothetical protein